MVTEPRADAPELSVVVPFYNEEENLRRYPAELYPHLDALGTTWELVLVDDGSRDRSRQVAEELGRGHPGVRLVAHPANRGLGAAVRTGIEAARGALILTLDADLTFHPSLAGRLLERYRQGDVDLVSGSPDLAGFDRVPWHRVMLSRGANLLYQAAIGRRVTSVTPIFRLYRAEAVRSLRLESEKFEINAEILAKLVLAGGRVAEVPARLTTRVHGVSKLDNAREIRNHLRLLGRILRWRLGR